MPKVYPIPSHKRTENLNAFTLMAAKCLFRILNKFICFHTGHRKRKIERLSPEWRPSAFSKYSTKFICFHTGHKREENWKASTLMATSVFSKYSNNSFVSTQVTKELKFGRLSPEWRPSTFSKYSTKFIYSHTGHKRAENWKAWINLSLFFYADHKILDNWMAFTWMITKCFFKIP